jgi:hypothetical protein
VRRITPIATGGAMVCVCLVAAAGCGTATTGARREGPAPTATVKTPSTSTPAIASDPAALAGMVRRDTSVSADVREDLAPCVGDDYPMDTDAGDLTSGDGPDLVVNVTTCGDGLGVAAYVYRMIGGKYQNVFADERPPVYGSVEDGHLQIIHEVYKSDDPLTYPTGQEATTYAWQGNRFVEVARTYSDFTRKSPSASPEPTSTEPVPQPASTPLDPGLPSGGASPRSLPHYQPSAPAPTGGAR